MSAGGEALGAGGFPQQASALGRKGAAGAAVLKRSGSDVSSGSKHSRRSSRGSRQGSSAGSSNGRRRGRKKEKIPPACVNTSPECPCAHNDWDNVRVKKGFITLRCRSCQLQWKTETDKIRKCLAFFQGASCVKGSLCPNPHVHRYKQSLAKRMATHGEDDEAPEPAAPRKKEKPAKKDVASGPPVFSAAPAVPAAAPPPVPPPVAFDPPRVAYKAAGAPPVPVPQALPFGTLPASAMLAGGMPHGGYHHHEFGVGADQRHSSSSSTGPPPLLNPQSKGSVSSPNDFTVVKRSTFGHKPHGHLETDSDLPGTPSNGSDKRTSLTIVQDDGQVEVDDDDDDAGSEHAVSEDDVEAMTSTNPEARRHSYQPTSRREAEKKREHGRTNSFDNLSATSNSAPPRNRSGDNLDTLAVTSSPYITSPGGTGTLAFDPLSTPAGSHFGSALGNVPSNSFGQPQNSPASFQSSAANVNASSFGHAPPNAQTSPAAYPANTPPGAYIQPTSSPGMYPTPSPSFQQQQQQQQHPPPNAQTSPAAFPSQAPGGGGTGSPFLQPAAAPLHGASVNNPYPGAGGPPPAASTTSPVTTPQNPSLQPLQTSLQQLQFMNQPYMHYPPTVS
ncbi:hypothetical protein DIPPA_22801 [Diplonema papillatum]|nr:hypothetical protein DIPPA_22801 [Diplonema papillatum]